jgi:RNA polymerase sigma factor (sigma-70 family)
MKGPRQQLEDQRLEAAIGHLGLVRRAARSVARCLPHVELDDLVSAGTLGLLEASSRYDARRGVPFPAYAYPRVKGAIIDEARRHDPRSLPVPLEAPVRTADGDVAPIDVTEDATAPKPDTHAELGELVEAVNDLPDREREILGLYTNGYSVGEIAAWQRCSGPRVSQLLSQARYRLVERLAA